MTAHSLKTPRTLLIPAMLDAHFPLLRWAFESASYHAVVLDQEDGISDVGLRNTHNDMCYPCVLITGQVITALRFGRYDPTRTVVMLPQAGDACRGSNYLHVLRRSLDTAGFSQVALLSLNVLGIDREIGLPITVTMIRRALAAVIFGDELMLLKNQTEPFEAVPGSAEALRQRWLFRLAESLRRNSGLSARATKHTCREIAADFKTLSRVDRPVQPVAIVGELYIKYCHLGNWNLEQYLREKGCQVCVNGFSWYVLYYMDTHLAEGPLWERLGFRLLMRYVSSVQRQMISTMLRVGFTALPPFQAFKAASAGFVPFSCTIGDGWLITAELAAWAQAGCKKAVCAQPFGCLPSHVCGRGLYASLQRKLNNMQLVSVDFDASGSDVMVKSRIQMLLDNREP